MYDAVINNLITYKVHLPHTLPTRPLFWPHITGAPSVVYPLSLSHGCFISVTHLETSSKISFPLVVLFIDFNPRGSSVTHRFDCHLGSVRSGTAVIYSKRECNKIFSLYYQLVTWIGGKFTGAISNCVSAQAHIWKCLLSLWAHKVTNLHQQWSWKLQD